MIRMDRSALGEPWEWSVAEFGMYSRHAASRRLRDALRRLRSPTVTTHPSSPAEIDAGACERLKVDLARNGEQGGDVMENAHSSV
jgi:hypothetical protein